MAILMVAAAVFEAFTEVGIKQSIIQNKHGAEPEYLNVAWWIQALRGLGLFVIGIIAAPWISSFYDKPELVRLLRFCFISVLFRGLISPRAHVLEKEYKFGRAVFLIQGSRILGSVITIVLAFILKNVLALVIGFVAEAAIMSLLSYLLVPFMPRLRIHREYLGEVMKFARGMFGLPILTIITMRTDVTVLGKLVTAGQLGMYHLALLLVERPMTLYSRIVAPVLLPAFSEKQSDTQKVGDIVLFLTRVITVFGMPIVMFMIICAEPILRVIYVPQYAAVAVPFGILSVAILVRMQSVPIASIFLALGQPHILRRFVGLRALILVVIIYPNIVWFGLSGAAMSVLLAYIIVLCIQVFYYMPKIIVLRLGDYATCWLQGLLTSVVWIGTFILLRFFAGPTTWMNLTIAALSCLSAWAVGLFLFRYCGSVNKNQEAVRL
jgi:O-antigen/teichoic acid export membrane protein